MRVPSQPILCSFALCALMSTAHAQTAPAPAAPAPAAPVQAAPAQAAPVQAAPVQAAPAEAAAAQAAPAEAASGCFPTCRDGFLCHEGQCISACNPPCADGELCVEGRACVPSEHYYLQGGPHGFAPVPPPPPPPPADWHPPAHVRVRKPRDYPHYQGYFGLQAGLGGQGSLQLADRRDNYDIYDEERDFDLRGSFGAEALMEFRLVRYFGIGPGARFLTARGNNGVGRTNRVDLLVVPTVHVPFKNLEIFVPIPLGLTFGSVPDGLDGESSAGLTLGLQPGLIVWLGQRFGLFGQIGLQGHVFGYERPNVDYALGFGRATVTLGVTFRD